jgi:hypothetical protein
MSASVIEWWYGLTEARREGILEEADQGHEGARESIIDVFEALDPIRREYFDEWVAEVRERS